MLRLGDEGVDDAVDGADDEDADAGDAIEGGCVRSGIVVVFILGSGAVWNGSFFETVSCLWVVACADCAGLVTASSCLAAGRS